MKNRVLLSACAVALLILQGCSAKPNVEVSVEPGPNKYVVSFYVRAKADEVTVKSVTINRGNCALSDSTQDSTIKLKFGQSFQGWGICNLHDVKEIEVSTDAGAFTFSFN